MNNDRKMLYQNKMANYAIGISAALFATGVWSLNFIIPFVIGRYSIFDFALFRFVISGCVGAIVLVLRRDRIYRMGIKDMAVIAWLSLTGYVGFFLLVSSSAMLAGPVIAPAILSLVPVVLSISGNLYQGSVAWRSFFIPLFFIATGLIVLNGYDYTMHRGYQLLPPYMGMLCAMGAVILWTCFGLFNQNALENRPTMDSSVWSAMLLVASAVEIVLFFPIGSSMGLFEIPTLGLSWSSAHSLWLWGVSLAFLSSVGGVWAWTIASRRLPVALSAQLVVFETIFGICFGLITQSRLPSFIDIGGIVLLIVGVVMATRVFYMSHSYTQIKHVE
ncbi:DMT family transporter [Celerinatantimonas yamalensis]|uniref:DMT family transporter n=1 Tax=Celerinatantimonas yamalensis TaxID=559956 RepID=A0ABW9G5P9_9GAMM